MKLLYNGKLEWEEIDFLEKNDKIILLKENIITSCIPDFLREYFQEIRNLSFEETPNYKKLLNILSCERV